MTDDWLYLADMAERIQRIQLYIQGGRDFLHSPKSLAIFTPASAAVQLGGGAQQGCKLRSRSSGKIWQVASFEHDY